MKISVDQFILAGETRRENPAGLRIRTAPTLQVVPALRATHVTHHDRGNKETVITFGVSRLHTSVEAAELYILEHDADVPTRGLVLLESEAGETTARRWLQNAAVSVVDRTHIGKTSRHQYEIRAGELLTEDPTTTT